MRLLMKCWVLACSASRSTMRKLPSAHGRISAVVQHHRSNAVPWLGVGSPLYLAANLPISGQLADGTPLEYLVLQIYGCAVGFLDLDAGHDLTLAGQLAKQLMPLRPLDALKYLEALASQVQHLMSDYTLSIEAVTMRLLD